MTLNTATAQACYRERTEQHDKSAMNTVASYHTFMCPECGNRRPVRGRVSRGWKAGFRCADCHTKKTEKSAAVSADMETAASSVR